MNIANSGSGNGVYNAIKFAANQQDMYIMSFNNSAQAARRIGFFLGSVAGDAVADGRLSILGDGKVGVGTNAPTELLEVFSETASTAIEVSAGKASTTTGEAKLVLRSLHSSSGTTYARSEIASLGTA